MNKGLLNIILLSCIELYGDFSLRFYAQTKKIHWLFNGVLGYIGVVYFLIQSLTYNNVLYVNGMWDGISAILECSAAYFILGDRLEKSSQYVGLVLIIAGMGLMKATK